MRTFLLIVILLLLCGPLRPWLGRHWALLLSVIGGAIGGVLFAGFVMHTSGRATPALPLLSAIVGAIAAGQAGPAWLRRIQKDGKDDKRSTRH